MSPLLECTEELQGCVVYILKNRGMLLVETWYHGKHKNKLMEWKASFDAMWILSADAKRYFFCRRVWRLSEFAIFIERQQTTIYCSDLFERFICFTAGLDWSLSFLSISQRWHDIENNDKVFIAQEWLWYQNDTVSNTPIVITA